MSEKKKQQVSGVRELLFDEDRLKIYYNRIFPYKLMFKWISYNKLVKRDNNSLFSLEEGITS